MSATQCLECGAPLPEAVVAAPLCPACALRGALESADSEPPPAENPDSGEPTAGARPLAPGDRFGDYELLDEIARGGMGVVYRARQVSLDRLVAIKMLLPGMSGPDYLRRFRAEASTAAGLHHPNIVAIHEVGAWRGQQFLVMDFVEGPSLAQWIAAGRARPPDFSQVARWVKGIAEAVQHAHDRGILHRDIKPSNVLIDERGQARVTDFGLAKHFDDQSQLTLSGQALGSPSYMPPEQADSSGAKVSRRSDVYGLGATLYHVVTGRAPFQGQSPTDVLRQVLTREPVSPRSLDTDVPRDLDTICLKCLEKEPARRYASAQEVAAELGRFLAGEPIVARPVGAPERLWQWCRRKPLAAGLMAILAVSVGLAGWFWWQAVVSSRQLEHERLQRAMDTALTAAWAGDHAAAELAIAEAKRYGASDDWVRLINGHVALNSLAPEEAVALLERAVTLAPRNVAARAMLATAHLFRGDLDQYSVSLEQLAGLEPETPEDYFFLGTAFMVGHPDTSKAVSLLEVARQKRPSGMAYHVLGVAESSHALDMGSWAIAKKGMDHCDWASELLGPNHPELLPPRMNTYNVALRLSPDGERAGVLQKAARAVRALEPIPSVHGQTQRAFYFELTGDLDAEVASWQRVAEISRVGLFASWYAAAMLRSDRSAEALDVLGRPNPSPDGFATVARAYLLLDRGRRAEAEELHRQASATRGFSKAQGETILLLAGAPERVVANAARLLDAAKPGQPDYQALLYLAGRVTAQELVDSAGQSRFGQSVAHGLIGMSRLAEGDRAAAREHFRRSVQTGAHATSEYHWSRAFLVRMEQDAHWPPWIPQRR